jgi:hypothetical protein
MPVTVPADGVIPGGKGIIPIHRAIPRSEKIILFIGSIPGI